MRSSDRDGQERMFLESYFGNLVGDFDPEIIRLGNFGVVQ
jgi:hypothetical protein